MRSGLADIVITMAGYLGSVRRRPKMGNPLGFAAAIGTAVVLWWAATHWPADAQLAFG